LNGFVFTSFQKEKGAGIAKKVQTSAERRQSFKWLVQATDASLVGNEIEQFCLIFITSTSVVRTKAFARG
jgi:hypothetical protein